MKTIAIDDNSHNILIETKKKMKKEGYDYPTHSDVIRWMKRKIEEG